MQLQWPEGAQASTFPGPEAAPGLARALGAVLLLSCLTAGPRSPKKARDCCGSLSESRPATPSPDP